MSRYTHIDPITIDEKEHWIKLAGKGTYIAKYAHLNPEFLKTSCLLTAAVLRWRYTERVWWKAQYGVKLTKSFILSHPLFQIGFGIELDDYDDHMVTICEGEVYHSFYKRFEWQVDDIDLEKYNDDEEIDLYQHLFGKTQYYVIFIPDV